MEWSIQIESCFRGENRSVYYSPYRKVVARKINASGVLWEHYEYTCSTLRKKGLLTNNRRVAEIPVEDVDIDDCTKLAVQWLGSNTGPPQQVLQSWNTTRIAREKILKAGSSIHDYYIQFPCLKITQGSELLSADFKHFYPGHENYLFDHWDIIRPHIMQLLSNCKSLSTDEKVLVRLLPRLFIRKLIYKYIDTKKKVYKLNISLYFRQSRCDPASIIGSFGTTISSKT